jgi:type III pantothenate kinase
MLLAVDSGNSRVKWALGDSGGWVARGVRLCGDSRLAEDLRAVAARAAAVRVCHVGADKTADLISDVCGEARFIKAAAQAAGVVNSYRPPQSLGADRWCGLLAARRCYGAAVIMQAGTAATIDGLREDGVFIGGLILPGVATALSALARETGLPKIAISTVGDAASDTPPTDTKAALAIGAVEAVAQTALAFRRRYLPRRKIVIAGGDADLVAPRLGAGVVRHPGLVLDGVRVLHFFSSGAKR